MGKEKKEEKRKRIRTHFNGARRLWIMPSVRESARSSKRWCKSEESAIGCVQESYERLKLMNEQEQAKLDLFLASIPMAICEPAVTDFQKALGISGRVASVLESPPKSEMIENWFENGRLPCSFSLQPVWEPILAQLEAALTNNRKALTNKQLEKMKTSQGVQSTQQKRDISKKLNLASLEPFVRSAVQMERKLISQMEAQLEDDKEGLCSLYRGGTKLGLLLNCFGAHVETIQMLRNLSSAELLLCGDSEVESLINQLPKDQQIVVLYTRDRLEKGKLPYAGHSCAICDCKTAEEMASFLNENGFNHVTADIIRRTGAYGRGALLFLSAEDLQISSERAEQKAWTALLEVHYKSQN